MVVFINFSIYIVLVWFRKMDGYLKSYLVVFGVLRIVVIIFCIVGNVFYCFKKKKKVLIFEKIWLRY